MKQKLRIIKPTGTVPNKSENVKWNWRNDYMKDLDAKSNYMKKKDVM